MQLDDAARRQRGGGDVDGRDRLGAREPDVGAGAVGQDRQRARARAGKVGRPVVQGRPRPITAIGGGAGRVGPARHQRDAAAGGCNRDRIDDLPRRQIDERDQIARRERDQRPPGGRRRRIAQAGRAQVVLTEVGGRVLRQEQQLLRGQAEARSVPLRDEDGLRRLLGPGLGHRDPGCLRAELPGHQHRRIDHRQVARPSVGGDQAAAVVAGRDLLGEIADRHRRDARRGRVQVQQVRGVHVDHGQLAAAGVGHEGEAPVPDVDRHRVVRRAAGCTGRSGAPTPAPGACRDPNRPTQPNATSVGRSRLRDGTGVGAGEQPAPAALPAARGAKGGGPGIARRISSGDSRGDSR